MPPEDVYAIHCYWELKSHNLIIEENVKPGSAEYEPMLGEWADGNLDNPRIQHVAELSPELRYPNRMVVIASATVNDAKGWAVLDGPQSEWYPKDDFPVGETAMTVLKIHVGRQLLGLTGKADRKRWWKPRKSRAPEEIVIAYEELLAKAIDGAPGEQAKHLSRSSLLKRHFAAMLMHTSRSMPVLRAELIVKTYKSLWEIASGEMIPCKEEVLDVFGVIGENFTSYLDALFELGRASEIRPLISILEPYWQHNLGYATLGRAAFKARDWDVAERLLQKRMQGGNNPERGEEISMLGAIWNSTGRETMARGLLTDGLKKLLDESADAEGSDVESYESWFQERKRLSWKFSPPMVRKCFKVPAFLNRR